MPKIRLPSLVTRSSRSWTVNQTPLQDLNGRVSASASDVSYWNAYEGDSYFTSVGNNDEGDASNWDKFRLLLWKNYKIQMRNKLQTVLEVTLPILFTIVLVAVRCAVQSKVVIDPTTYKPFDVSNIPEERRLCCKEIYYSPKNQVTDKLMQIIQQDFFNQTDFHYSFSGFETEEELEKQYANSTSTLGVKSKEDSEPLDDEAQLSSPVLAGIVFTNEFPQGEFPNSIKYKLRFPATPRATFDFFEDRFGLKKIWFTEILYPIVQLFGPRAADKVTGGVPGYYDEGFLFLQYSVETTLAKYLLKNDSVLDDYDIKLQRFPYPGYIDDKFLFTLQGILPLTLILSLIFPVINITKLVVVEKERRLKEYMRMMGLPNWLHWTAWFIKSFLGLAVSTFIITILLKIRIIESQVLAILPNAEPTLIYVTFLTHIFQLVCFSFFISTLFKTANSAAIVAAILWFIFFIPFAFIQPRYNILSRETKILWSFGTNIGMCFCCQLFCMFEGTELGAQWSTVFQGVTPDDTFCLADCMFVMIANGFFYLFLTIYVEAVWPGEYGIPQPWYFLFTKWYWTGELRQEVNFSRESKDGWGNNKKKDFFETVPSTSIPGIQIKGLTKKFGESKIAVNNLTLDLYQNEIFVLLGHNAAGKTTTMSLLAGIFPPTSGTALINGHDICKNMKAVRRSLGLCPQTNVLFAELTVEEHLKFFSILKGLEKSEVDSEVERMIRAIGLEDKKATRAKALSGGMKRRLSVGIAFCAGSKVVLLDEPSSGLDPGARRAIWDLIQGEKKGRTILLSTHYMDEADILADRIAIMAEGEVQCCGSSLFLKKKYGCGYHLVIVKDPGCSVQNITDILKAKLEDVEEEHNVGAELSYALPDNQSHLFAQVFEDLERRKGELGIASYGASITTMEEVFMRVGQLLDQRDLESSGSVGGGSDKTAGRVSGGSPKQHVGVGDTALNVTFLNGSTMSAKRERGQEVIKMNSGISLRCQQFWAMVAKKAIFNVRKSGLVMAKIAIPAIYLTLILFVLTTIPGFHDPPAHPLVLDDYELFGKTISALRCQNDSSVCKGYMNYLTGKEKEFEKIQRNQTFDEEILDKAAKDLPLVNFRYLVGFDERKENSTNKTELIGLFNNQPLHTPPLALNLITNAILNSGNISSNYEVEVTNHPFEYGTSNIEEFGTYFTIGFQVGLHLSLAMGFMTGIYSIFPIKERNLGSKHLQLVSGANFVIFWVANLLVDLVTYALPCLAVHFILLAYQVQDFYSVEVQLYLLGVFYSFAFAVLPLMYLSSGVFRIPSSGLVGMGVFNVLTGFATIFVVSILENPELEQEDLASTLHRIFLIFPTYALGKGIIQISVNHQLGKACGEINLEFFCDVAPTSPCCAKLKANVLDWEEAGIGKNLVSMITFGIFCWIILLIWESGLFKSILGGVKQEIEKLKTVDNNNFGHEDSDVHKERERIQASNLEELCKTDNLVIRDMTKVYPNGTLAVDRISLGVKKGECFGLLGANGAGKTSTFKMLTGELPISKGDAYVYTKCIRTELKKAHRNMGYCPQFDSLIEEMTGRETLRMYSRLRGIKEREVEDMILKLADELLFTEFLDKIVKSYSGGNKRKLSTAVALVGNPPIVFLDEPTCGIDPMARRHLWECITRIRDAGTSVILTSHSMEETEFLCTRLAIMVNGKFRCLGSPQQLKSKFGEGYTLTAQTQVCNEIEDGDDKGTLRNSRRGVSIQNNSQQQDKWRLKLSDLRLFIEESLPGCTLEDLHQGFLHYRVQSDKVTWGQMFTVMEAAKEKFNVEAYSVGQTSLEQVFLNFIKAQVNSDSIIVEL